MIDRRDRDSTYYTWKETKEYDAMNKECNEWQKRP
jgi:hypothetical protein